MTGDVEDTLEIQSNKKPYPPAIQFLLAFAIVWFAAILALMIYEFYINPEADYEWWIYIPATIWGLISITVIITFTWTLFSKNSKYKSLTITPSEWKITTHKGKILTMRTSSIRSIKIRLVKNFSAYLRITKR